MKSIYNNIKFNDHFHIQNTNNFHINIVDSIEKKQLILNSLSGEKGTYERLTPCRSK